MNRTNISSGSPWESIAGYSRAVRIGPHIFVAGTTASDSQGQVVGGDDPYRQTIYILEKIQAALGQAGAEMKDVVRSRMFVVNVDHWEAIARAHNEFFHQVRPAATLVEVNRLIDPAMLVEIEIDALIGSSAHAQQ